MPTRVNVGKKAIRCLGIAESFRKEAGSKAVLAGVVIRSDLLVDGLVLASCTVGGMDSTDSIISMWKSLNRDDVNFILLGGSVISWFNVVNLGKLYDTTSTPLICITYRESEGLDDVFKRRFPEDWAQRLEVHNRNGERHPIVLKTGFKVFVRCFGLSVEDAKKLIDKFTLEGRYPEPVRLAKMIARSALRFKEL
ncbi:MAG: DUF99 family protein [Candidatus Caldarchaeum sp.]